MSQTESLGIADATRWAGVAASMVDYLESWLAEVDEPPPVPRGIFAGARRFFKHALEGIALNRHERFQPEIPIMAGISNLTIALSVFHRLTTPLGKLVEIEPKVQEYLACLDTVEKKGDRSEALEAGVRALKEFFQQLQEQGNRARHAAFAKAESPKP